jgi:hypothetical protein
MKIFTFLAAVCLLGISSCSQKICPAYSETDSVQQNMYAKELRAGQPGAARI